MEFKHFYHNLYISIENINLFKKKLPIYEKKLRKYELKIYRKILVYFDDLYFCLID